MAKYEEHQCYCMLCGKAGIPIRRKQGFQHQALHRKKLYCPYCKTVVNHIEVRTFEEKEKFLQDFQAGLYKQEAEISLGVCKNE